MSPATNVRLPPTHGATKRHRLSTKPSPAGKGDHEVVDEEKANHPTHGVPQRHRLSTKPPPWGRWHAKHDGEGRAYPLTRSRGSSPKGRAFERHLASSRKTNANHQTHGAPHRHRLPTKPPSEREGDRDSGGRSLRRVQFSARPIPTAFSFVSHSPSVSHSLDSSLSEGALGNAYIAPIPTNGVPHRHNLPSPVGAIQTASKSPAGDRRSPLQGFARIFYFF